MHNSVTWPPTSLRDGRALLLLFAGRESETVEGQASAQGPGLPHPFGLQDASEHACRGRLGSMSGTAPKLAPNFGNGVACLGAAGSPILWWTGSFYAHLQGCCGCKYWEAVASPACTIRALRGHGASGWTQQSLLHPGLERHWAWGLCRWLPSWGGKEQGREAGRREGQARAAGHCCS